MTKFNWEIIHERNRITGCEVQSGTAIKDPVISFPLGIKGGGKEDGD